MELEIYDFSFTDDIPDVPGVRVVGDLEVQVDPLPHGAQALQARHTYTSLQHSGSFSTISLSYIAGAVSPDSQIHKIILIGDLIFCKNFLDGNMCLFQSVPPPEGVRGGSTGR